MSVVSNHLRQASGFDAVAVHCEETIVGLDVPERKGIGSAKTDMKLSIWQSLNVKHIQESTDGALRSNCRKLSAQESVICLCFQWTTFSSMHATMSGFATQGS